MPKRKPGELFPLESGILVAGYEAYPEPIYTYGYVYEAFPDWRARELIEYGTAYKAFARLVGFEMLDRGDPVPSEVSSATMHPHTITMAGLDALIRNGFSPE